MAEILKVLDQDINTIKINGENYISLTDMAKTKNKDRADYIIQNWMRVRYTIEYLGIWESLHNVDFKPIEFDGLKIRSFYAMF